MATRKGWRPAAALCGAALLMAAGAARAQPGEAPVARPPEAEAPRDQRMKAQTPPAAEAPRDERVQAQAPPAPEPQRIDKQASHENGTQLIVNSLAPRRTSVALNVTITTGNVDVRLNGFGVTLVDDQGARHQMVPPADNPELRIAKHSALEGDLVFSGRLNPQARSLTLLVNERAGSADGRTAGTPQLRIQFPVQPQQTGAAEPPDDGPAASRTAAAPLPAGDAPIRTEALAASVLAPAEAEASSAGASRLGAGGAGAAGIAPGRLSVEQLRQDLRARRTERGELVALPGDVLFDFDKADIRRDAEPTLQKLARLIVETRPRRVLVEGHTDSHGSDAYNQRLSARRAQAVERWLAGNGAGGPRYASRGFGEGRPAAPNARPNGADDPDGRQRNRRVEVVLQRA